MPWPNPTAACAPGPTPLVLVGCSKIWPVFRKPCFVQSSHSPQPSQLAILRPSAHSQFTVLRRPLEKGMPKVSVPPPWAGPQDTTSALSTHPFLLNPWQSLRVPAVAGCRFRAGGEGEGVGGGLPDALRSGLASQVLSQGPLGAVPHASPRPQPLAIRAAAGRGRGRGSRGSRQVREASPPRPAQQKPGLGEGREAREAGGGASAFLEPHWPAARSERYKAGRPLPRRTGPGRHTGLRHPGCAARPAAPRPFFSARRPLPRRPRPRLPRDTGPGKFVRARAGAPRSAARPSAPARPEGSAPNPGGGGRAPRPRPGPRPGPPWAPRPAACRSRSASCWWGRRSAGPTPAAARRCTRNRRFAMQM